MVKLKDFTAFLTTSLFCITFVYGTGSDLNVGEYISKHKERIENAAPDDWKTYADCANALVSKKIVTDEIIKWIDRSISIRETMYNRTVKGDYLVLKGAIRAGQAEYVRAIELAKQENRNEEISTIQWKIMISMGIENLNKFQAESQ
ncbi:MAG: hypothetical protein KFF73_06890 [Cyclobacteriaceae bacterium]|nr:hypothetical protein [Cyclobacteriaceae bacterium]